MSEKIIIIGGGIIGLTAAYFFSEKKYHVTVLEKQHFGQEASWAGAGMLMIYPHFSPFERSLAKLSLAMYPYLCEKLQQETHIDPEFIPLPLLLVDLDEPELWQFDIDIQAQPISFEDFHLFPNIHIQKNASITSHCASVRNPRLLKALYAALEKKGAKLLSHTTAHHIDEKKKTVHTDRGIYYADHILIATGAWAPELFKSLHLECHVKPIRGQMVLLKPQKPITDIPCMIMRNNGFYLVPRQDGLIYAGATTEDVGFQKMPSQHSYAWVLENAYALCPLLKQANIIATWTGLRPGGLTFPLIEKISDHGIYGAVGHYRNGLNFAPATAQKLVGMVM